MRVEELRRDARTIFEAALKAADASEAVGRHLVWSGGSLCAGEARFSLGDGRRVWLIAVGKAAPAMAEAVERVLAKASRDGSGGRMSGGLFSGDAAFESDGKARRRLAEVAVAAGLIVTKSGHAAGYRRWAGYLEGSAVIEAGHPVPDDESVRAGQAVLALLERVNPTDLVIVAVSGGASALLCAPVHGISLEAKRRTTDLLLRAGATIDELNCVRKHLSLLKGGNLAARANGAEVLGLILSDVVGDALDVIGSGLTAPDPASFQEALAVLERRGLLAEVRVAGGQVEAVPVEVRRHLELGAAGLLPETPKPGDPAFARTTNVIVGSGRLALEAAKHEAERLGYRAVVRSSTLEGEAREVARSQVAAALEARRDGGSLPVCLLTGGETTVTVRGAGRGGRNQEFALAAAMAFEGVQEMVCLAAGTDGTDGPTDAAGAVVDGDTVCRAKALGLDAAESLKRNDSYTFFAGLGDLVMTGPTGTNVMDINVMLIGDAVA